MKMVFCRGCGQSIAETACSCPSCGAGQSVLPSESDTWGSWTAWAIACVPVIGAIFAALPAKVLGHGSSYLFLVTLGLNVFLCSMDANALKAKGYTEAQLGNIFLIPVYLFRRAKLLGEKPAYAILWCVLFGLQLLGSL